MAIINMVIKGSGTSSINNQDKTINENGSYTYDNGYTGLGTVTVNVPTFTKISAYPNGVSAYEENLDVLISDGNLTLKSNNPIDIPECILGICENGFCITHDGKKTMYYRRFKNEIVGEEIDNNILRDNYNNILNGFNKIQYPMYGNTCIATNGIENNRAKSFVVFGMNQTDNFVRCIDYSKQKSNIISSFGDRFCYHSNDGIVYIYDVVQDDDYEITDIDFNNVEMNVICYRHQNMDYIVNYDSQTKWNVNLNELNPSFVHDGSIDITKMGLDIIGCQQTKDEKHILCKNGYITINDDNLIEHTYPNIIVNAMGGIGVHHFQALYDGYFGFGMDDGRYILCWYDTETGDIETPFVRVFEAYHDDESRIYHRFFSGYGEYWTIPNFPISHGYIASKTEIEKRDNLYNIMENNKCIDIGNKNTTNGLLVGFDEGDKLFVNTLFRESILTLGASHQSQTIIVEGVE